MLCFLIRIAYLGDSNEHTQYTIFNIKKESHPQLSQICSYGMFSKGPKNELSPLKNDCQPLVAHASLPMLVKFSKRTGVSQTRAALHGQQGSKNYSFEVVAMQSHCTMLRAMSRAKPCKKEPL